jgi:SpoVK/Ycf46/Vps4 family AAA+-type ATPase
MVTGNPNPNVVVMATTNYPWKLDETVLCHFDTKIYIKLPTATDICMIIKTEFTNNFIKKALAAPGGGDGDDNKAAAAAAALKPVQIFNFYRDKYFPTTLSDDNLMTLASQLEQLLFSGADVSHLCKIVFTSMGDEARRDGRFTPTTMEDPKTLVMNPQTKQVESASNVKSAAYDQDFIFHLFNPEKEQQQEETNDDHDAATRKITLRPHMDMFLQAVGTIKPTAQSETVQALNNYAAAGP